jgi:diacylglycerol kinase family enzyme
VTRRRLAAIVALLVAPVTLVLAVVVAVQALPRGLAVVGCVVLALIAGWYGVLRRGALRLVALVVAAASLGGASLLLVRGRLLDLALIVSGMALFVAAARAAFTVHARRPAVSPPHHPVMVLNPRSGGGKAERFSLAAEARRRGIESVSLRPGDDLQALARDAVSRGADALAMAGGDGSQAIVAAVAAELCLPYACIPAGTRNHFALDLGVDRGDVVGALDAFVDGSEHRVDLGEVNGRVFVNNVSLGLYAEAVQRADYRNAKIHTLLGTAADVLGADRLPDLHWTGPDGLEHEAGAAILISNNRYRLGNAVGSGTRPRMDAGVLGVIVVAAPTVRGGRDQPVHRLWHEWSTTAFEVHSGASVPAGIDGEAAVLDSPVRFRIKPGVLRVRVARRHPGASPSAMAPEGLWEAVRTLTRIAVGRV